MTFIADRNRSQIGPPASPLKEGEITPINDGNWNDGNLTDRTLAPESLISSPLTSSMLLGSQENLQLIDVSSGSNSMLNSTNIEDEFNQEFDPEKIANLQCKQIRTWAREKIETGGNYQIQIQTKESETQFQGEFRKQSETQVQAEFRKESETQFQAEFCKESETQSVAAESLYEFRSNSYYGATFETAAAVPEPQPQGQSRFATLLRPLRGKKQKDRSKRHTVAIDFDWWQKFRRPKSSGTSTGTSGNSTGNCGTSIGTSTGTSTGNSTGTFGIFGNSGTSTGTSTASSLKSPTTEKPTEKKVSTTWSPTKSLRKIRAFSSKDVRILSPRKKQPKIPQIPTSSSSSTIQSPILAPPPKPEIPIGRLESNSNRIPTGRLELEPPQLRGIVHSLSDTEILSNSLKMRQKASQSDDEGSGAGISPENFCSSAVSQNSVKDSNNVHLKSGRATVRYLESCV